MTAVRMRTPTGVMADVEAVSMASAKNSMAEVLNSARENGVVALTKHGKVEAVVIPADVYDDFMRLFGDPLDRMQARFESLLASMQGPKAAAAMDAVFGPVPERPRDKPHLLIVR